MFPGSFLVHSVILFEVIVGEKVVSRVGNRWERGQVGWALPTRYDQKIW